MQDFIDIEEDEYFGDELLSESVETTEKHNFDLRITETNLNEIVMGGSGSKTGNEGDVKISGLSEENTKKLLSRASKDISSKDEDEKEFFMRGRISKF